MIILRYVCYPVDHDHDYGGQERHCANIVGLVLQYDRP